MQLTVVVVVVEDEEDGRKRPELDSGIRLVMRTGITTEHGWDKISPARVERVVTLWGIAGSNVLNFTGVCGT